MDGRGADGLRRCRRPAALSRILCHEYRPTDKGIALYPVFVAIAQWGDQYLADPEGPPVEFAHRDCGEVVRVVPTCAAGHEIEDLRRIASRPGPGALPVPAG